MVSRRKILSRSRDDLHLDAPVPNSEQDEEDIWYNKEKLYKVGIVFDIFILKKTNSLRFPNLFSNVRMKNIL